MRCLWLLHGKKRVSLTQGAEACHLRKCWLVLNSPDDSWPLLHYKENIKTRLGLVKVVNIWGKQTVTLPSNCPYKILQLCFKNSLTVRYWHSPNYDKIWNLRLLHSQSPTRERERERERESTRFLDTTMSWRLVLLSSGKLIGWAKILWVSESNFGKG
jgi:hypothetical protein